MIKIVAHTSAKFQIILLDSEGNEKLKTPFQNNLVLENSLALGSTAHNALQVGTGSTPPVWGDTFLESHLAGTLDDTHTLTSSFNETTKLYTLKDSMIFTFPLGGVVGNVSELGMSNSSADTQTVSTRALIKDIGGNPTTITVTASDQLVVNYEYSRIYDLTEQAITFTFDAVGYPAKFTICRGDGNSLDVDGVQPYRNMDTDTVAFYADGDAQKMTVNATTKIATGTTLSSSDSRVITNLLSVTSTFATNIFTTTHTIDAGLTKINDTDWQTIAFCTSTNMSASSLNAILTIDGPTYPSKNNTEVAQLVLVYEERFNGA